VEQTNVLLRRLAPGDAEALVAFYNGLNEDSKRTFCPLGTATTVETCADVVTDNSGVGGAKYDLVAVCGAEIVGWSFLWGLAPTYDAGGPGDGADPNGNRGPTFGLAVADAFQGRGLGKALMSQVMAWARTEAIPQVLLTVVQDNVIAWRLYEKMGFVRYGAFIGEDGLPYYRMRANLG
jgi:ribosomal protein S18 acetylase RimI-like enzyme